MDGSTAVMTLGTATGVCVCVSVCVCDTEYHEKLDQTNPYAPIPSVSDFRVGFGYLNTFSQGIWSARESFKTMVILRGFLIITVNELFGMVISGPMW